MTYNITDGFIPKYREEFIIRAQQQKRMLDGLSEEGGVFVGDVCHFPRFGQAETTKASRLQELAMNGVPIDWVKIQAEPEFITFGIWDPDKSKMTIPMAGPFAKASVKAVNRAKDRQHIECVADAATNGVKNTKNEVETVTTLGSYDDEIDLEMVAEAIVQLGTDEMFEGERVSIITPFKINVQQQLDPILHKMDVKTNRVWDRIDWRTYERLPGNGTAGAGWAAAGATGVDCFIHAQSAVMHATNDDDVEINERMGSRLGDLIGRWFQTASGVVEPKGLIRIKGKLDFALHRVPVRTYETNADMLPA